MTASLYLIPTPIDNESSLNKEAFDLLYTAANSKDWLVVVEEHKEARRRWLNWGLPRETIDHFILYNEHSTDQDQDELIDHLLKGRSVALMSDCGLPAFCDPGQKLVYRCHQKNIKVTSAPFSNSVVLALALSGLSHEEFYFLGFLPKENGELEKKITQALNNKSTTILMDTPYRLKKTLLKISEISVKHNTVREVFLAMDLNKKEEKLILTNTKKLTELEFNKREFILIIGAKF